jgi:DNA adenine methylase
MVRSLPTENVSTKRPVAPIYRDTDCESTARVPVLRRRRRHHLAFGWYGGKFSHLDWLLPLLPNDAHHYCEPFAGSAAVLINRPPAPVETYNDLDGDVVNFFRVLRDDPDALIRAISLTPFSREEFYEAIYVSDASLPPVERARRFYVRARQARTGLAQSASLGRWANCKQTSRAGMSGVVSRWLGGVEDLEFIAQRLLRVQIENRPALDVIRLYDSPGTLFYCDPPYPAESRGDAHAYAYEMSVDEHRALAQALRRCRGRVAVSGYRCDLLDTLYNDWRRVDAPVRTAHSVKQPRQESLWMNY